MFLLNQCLLAPPGKIIRVFIHAILEARLIHACPITSPTVVPAQAVMSKDVPFLPLESAVEVRAEAACPDDTKIDLSIWAPLDNTNSQAKARVILCRFVVHWWCYYYTKIARCWLV
jgi:hypothetical protein